MVAARLLPKTFSCSLPELSPSSPAGPSSLLQSLLLASASVLPWLPTSSLWRHQRPSQTPQIAWRHRLGSMPCLAGKHTSNAQPPQQGLQHEQKQRFLSPVPLSLTKLIPNPTLLSVLPAAPSTRPPMASGHFSCCVALSLAPVPADAHSPFTPGCNMLVVVLQSPTLAWSPSPGMVCLGAALLPRNQLCAPHTARLPWARSCSEEFTRELFLGATRDLKGCLSKQTNH